MMKSTNEFVVINGTDSELWGDIDSKIDDKWGNKVWNYTLDKYNAKKKSISVNSNILNKKNTNE